MEEKILEDFRAELLMELDDLDNLMCGSFEVYRFMIDFAVKKGFKMVVDIGCSSAYQSVLCKGKIDYTGIDSAPKARRFFAKKNDVRYFAYTYPFPLFDTFKEDLAISVLALRLAMFCRRRGSKRTI